MNVFPSEWGQVSQTVLGHWKMMVGQLCEGFLQIHGIPESDRGGDQRKSTGLVRLFGTDAVRHGAKPVKKHRSRERIPSLPFVETDCYSPAQFRTLQPFQCE
jgi:hypothetical protein